MSELNAGTTFGRYVVVRELGRGGMGAVYLVRQSGLGGLFALKVLEAPGARLRQRVLDEGRSQARVRHPNVVLMVELLELPEGLGLVMEYVNGPTLADWLRGRDLPLPEALRIFDAIVQGVAAAHAEGLVHRDLKPSNVLMASASPLPVPKVADFGLVKSLDGGEPGLTRTGMMMGTVGWMAPEQSEDASRVDQRADIYSLGCILYRLVCGRGPFEDMSNLDFLNAAHRGTWVRPRELNPALPEDVVAAIEGCLQPNRELRIASCGELQRVLGGAELSAERRAPALPGVATWSDELTGPGTASSPTLAPEQPPVQRPSPIVVPPVSVGSAPAARRRGVPLFAVMFLGAAASMLLVVSLPFRAAPPAPAPMSAEPLAGDSRGAAGGEAVRAERTSPPAAPKSSARPPAPPAAEVPMPEYAPPAEPPPTNARPTNASSARLKIISEPGIRSVCVQAEARCYEGGAVPPGTYPIWVKGASGEAWQAGTVTLEAGDEVVLRCSAVDRTCRR